MMMSYKIFKSENVKGSVNEVEIDRSGEVFLSIGIPIYSKNLIRDLHVWTVALILWA